MNLQIQLRNLNANPALSALIEEKLRQLGQRLQISAATVLVELRRELTPPVRIHAHLAVPGPDLIAEGTDHTGPAAWLKVCRALERQAEHRRSKQRGKWRSKLSQTRLGRMAASLIGR